MVRLEEATLKSTTRPLSDFYLKAVIKEIEQTTVAVSVMGTTSAKLKEMANLVVPIGDSLKGKRPEVDKTRKSLVRRIHNVVVSSTKPRQASKALRELSTEVKEVQNLLKKGTGDTESIIQVGGFEVVNTWGYTQAEIRPVRRILERASKALVKVGLPTVATGLVELNPEKVGGSLFVVYIPENDLLVFDLGQSGPADSEKIFAVLAERLWMQEFVKADKETWGNGKGLPSFSKAFADKLVGQKMSGDVTARLQVTVGKLAANWA